LNFAWYRALNPAALLKVGCAGWNRGMAAVASSLQAKPTMAAELRAAVAACRGALVVVGVASGFINVLMLTGPLFMLQVYDRVLSSRSIPTLVALLLLAALLFALQGIFDALRGRLLSRIGRSLAESLNFRVFGSMVDASLAKTIPGEELQAIRDLDSIRSFASGTGIPAFFDLPWMPLYIGICFLFHALIGGAVLAGAVMLCTFTALADVMTRRQTGELVAIGAARREIAETTRRNADVVHALGMRGRMAERWTSQDASYLDRQEYNADIVAGFGSLSRMLRMFLQSGVLALGAYLVVNQEATAGVMLAATILSIRALAPVELVIVNWKAFNNARQSWHRLSELLKLLPSEQHHIPLTRPVHGVRVASVSIVPPGAVSPVVRNVSFALDAGSALGVIGPSASGKSSLARALVGAWKPTQGVIRIDGATFDQWNSDELGSCIGFLPQEVELFAGTIAQNISRFAADTDANALMAAAAAADVHDVILGLPNGYETQVGEGGALLSGGQRQRIALARALYGEPFLVVLDEPNSNLDAEGEKALTKAILGIRLRRGVAVVIAHRSSVLSVVDKVMVLNEGTVQAFGPRDQIIPQLFKRPSAPAPISVADAATGRRPRNARANE
jgi:PrtD family type I secretion system ABC transporter